MRSFATFGALALLAAASAFGQNSGQRLTADIPFEFHVATGVMPAGHYEVTLSRSTVSLDCFDCQARAIAGMISIGGGINDARPDGRLVFTKYGSTYFLSEVWSPETAVGSALPKSKTEREVARTASLAPTSQVLLARR
jgi:hypothetical protein